MIKIDWLNNATRVADGARGYLVAGPLQGSYLVNLAGTVETIPADHVAIQLCKGAAYVDGSTVGKTTGTGYAR